MTTTKQLPTPIKLLLVDDSWVLRRVLRDTLSHRSDIEIVGEAGNGIEALGMILNIAPDVIMMDMEMPTMDGITTLQHLMIHTPTPTIMLSSLSKNGSARCFDALKYGAVDFVSKNTFFKGMGMTAHGELVVEKIYEAARTKVHSIDPMQQGSEKGALARTREKVLFCEDCGTRHIVQNWPQTGESVKCQNCGDEISLTGGKRFRRVNFVTVIGAGEGGYANLLKIIPELNPEMGGALIVVVYDEQEHVESFCKYLDTISDFKVSMVQDGLTLEGGGCYLASDLDQVSLSPYSGNFTLQVDATPVSQSMGRIDSLMIGVSDLLKDRVAGVLLSGGNEDGSRGMEAILKNKGTCLVLNPENCLQKGMSVAAMKKFALQEDLDEGGVAKQIQQIHFSYKENVITA